MVPLHTWIVLASVSFNYINAELPNFSGNGETNTFWNDLAKQELNKAKLKPNIAVAKNVIIFLGDGMGISTVTAARILKGQLKNKTGEEGHLSFEVFPNVGLSKTYNQDAQTADSAGTATAFLCGVKTNYGVIGVDARSRRKNCSTERGTELQSILDWSKTAGKSVGIVTTTRITHATPSAAYAHTVNRDWEGDADMVHITGGCRDIAKQLVDDNIDINVILGGGRNRFMRNTDTDPEAGLNSKKGRKDGRNLIEDWKQKQHKKGRNYQYVWNATSFKAVNAQETDYLLGLFSDSNMNYELERKTDKGGEPSLAEMTEKAIQILSKNSEGFFLLVEGGRIDHAHHDGNAVKALHDTLAFDDAVAKGVTMTSVSDTLLVTTADHSHTLTIGGYPTRGNPIFGLTDDREGGYELAKDGKPFTTLSYADGPGGYATNTSATRPDPRDTNTHDKDYLQQAGVPLGWETHGGEDVAIYASGPMSHLIHGVHEQHYIAHVLAYASCVGGYSSHDSCAMSDVNAMNTNSAAVSNFNIHHSVVMFLLAALVL